MSVHTELATDARHAYELDQKISATEAFAISGQFQAPFVIPFLLLRLVVPYSIRWNYGGRLL